MPKIANSARGAIAMDSRPQPITFLFFLTANHMVNPMHGIQMESGSVNVNILLPP